MLNPRLDRALDEVAKLTPDTCPCKREVILVEALHGLAESYGLRLEPAFIERDASIPFKVVGTAAQGDPFKQAQKEVLEPLLDLVGTPVPERAQRIPAADLEQALRAVNQRQFQAA